MRIVILGARGMLGRDLAAAAAAAGFDVSGFDLPELDITRDDGGFDRIPACDWVVNCAAYTDVDGAESHRETAFAVNGEGAGRVARWCAGAKVPLLHVSTDYVFDGTKHAPYKEEDSTNPPDVYGESKLAGEKAVAAAGGQYVVARTQALFGKHGRNFVDAIRTRLLKDETLRVVKDQTVCPTYTRHLAAAILRLLNCGRRGIVHVSASGSCTWHEFACAIAARVRPGVAVQAVTTAEFPRPARRPAYSVLEKDRYELWTGHRMPEWQDGLKEYLKA